MVSMTETEFNREFIVRYYPTRGKTWNNRMVTYRQMKEIINDDALFERQIARIKNLKNDVLTINLRRIGSFKIGPQ